ncbi:MAG: VanW family protein [Solirubrobacterales bacterium]
MSRRNAWLIAAACAVLIWVLSGFLLRAFSSGEVLGGTNISGTELGGESRTDAARVIGEMEPESIQLLGSQNEITVRAPQAGLVVDSQSSADRAYSAGRNGVGAILAGPAGLMIDREVKPVYEPVNVKRLNRTVNRIAEEVDREPYVGALSINGKTLAVTADQPKAGLRVQRNSIKDDILEAFQTGRESIEIPVSRRPAPSPAEVRQVAREAERYLRQPLRITTAGGPAEFTPQQVAGVLTIESTGDGADTAIQLGADPAEVETLVANLADNRDLPAKNATLDTPSLPPVNLTEQGDLTWSPKPDAATVRQASDGRQIKQDKAVSNTIRAIERDQHQVRFPTEKTKPDVTASELKNATSLLGTFTTSFSCCEPRVTNIQRMAQTVDGTVIGPGEQFSLNGIAGERTRANGYKPAPTIGENNELIDTVGGGVSQFSTTTYNAAYFAGLQIDSHTPHSFYITRYPAGREATLNFGTIDLLWTNDTETPVVVRSSASDTAVTVSIYGGNGGRRVRAETQSRSGNSQGGFDIKIDRVIVDGDGSRRRDSFTTVYGLPSE